MKTNQVTPKKESDSNDAADMQRQDEEDLAAYNAEMKHQEELYERACKRYEDSHPTGSPHTH